MSRQTLEIYVVHAPCPCSSQKPDPKLVAFLERLEQLRPQLSCTLTYQVYSIGQNLAQFRTRTVLSEMLRSEGTDSLPVLFLGDRMIARGAFPDSDHLKMILQDY